MSPDGMPPSPHALMERTLHAHRILITGASGFMGSWLAEHLVERGARVVNLLSHWEPRGRFVQSGLVCNERASLQVARPLTATPIQASRLWWRRLGPRTAYILATAGLGVLGLAVGRILNGVIARLPRYPRSSIRVPAIELLTGALYVACLWRFGWQYALVPALVLVSLLVPIALIDAEHWILPFELTLPGIAAGVALSIPLGVQHVEGALWGVTVGFLGFRALEYLGWCIFRRETLGGGDKYLLALLGAFLTSRPLPFVVALASLQAALFSLTQRLRSRRTGDDAPASSQAAGRERDMPLAPPEAVEMPPPRITWRFLAPGLSPWRRVMLLPYSLLIQPIPDRPPPVEELKSTPEVVSLPFGPWMVLAGLEMMFLHA